MAKNRQFQNSTRIPQYTSTYTWKSTTTTLTRDYDTNYNTTLNNNNNNNGFYNTSNYNYSYDKVSNNQDVEIPIEKEQIFVNNKININNSLSSNISYNKTEKVYEKYKEDANLCPVNRNLSVYFNGSNYGIMTDSVQIKDSFNVSFEFRTNATNGLVMLMADNKNKDSFFVELVNSQLRACLNINGEPDSAWTEFPTKILSSYIWVDVNIKIIGNTINMSVRDKNYIKTHRNQFTIPIRNDLFIAGHSTTVYPPSTLRSKTFFYGEIRNLKVNNNPATWYLAN